nr:MAG TPA: hypothetical protein [Caudoviricetes sp.]
MAKVELFGKSILSGKMIRSNRSHSWWWNKSELGAIYGYRD